MPTTAERVRTHTGPAILSYGFRPFFLFGAVWAALVVAVWLPMLGGLLTLPTALSPLEWHVHELIYGYVPAIVAGFLLTAVPNWTGRLPVTGTPLLALVSVWAAGRLAVLLSARIGAPLAAAIDLLFLACLAGVIAREIIAGRNLGNLKVLALVGLLLIGNAVFHAEASLMNGGSGYGIRIGIGGAVLLITLIGGRIIPSFTRNWLARQSPGRLPISIRAIRRGQPCHRRLGDRLLDRLSACAGQPLVWPLWLACCTRCVLHDGQAIAPLVSRWFWCCTLATPLCPSASCC